MFSFLALHSLPSDLQLSILALEITLLVLLKSAVGTYGILLESFHR